MPTKTASPPATEGPPDPTPAEAPSPGKTPATGEAPTRAGGFSLRSWPLRHKLGAVLLLGLLGLGLYFFVADKGLYYRFFYYFFDHVRVADSRTALLTLALLGGVAGFFSPCAFALLPGYASYYLTLPDRATRQVRSALRLGGLTGAGILAFYLAVGVVVVAVGEGVKPFIPALAPMVGVLLVVLGLALLLGWSWNLDYLHRRLAKVSARHDPQPGSAPALLLYGLGFGAASAACSAPIFVALALAAVAFGGWGLALAAVLAYGLAMVVLVTLTTLLLARSKAALVDRLKASTGRIKQAAGVVLVLVGGYLTYFYLFWLAGR